MKQQLKRGHALGDPDCHWRTLSFQNSRPPWIWVSMLLREGEGLKRRNAWVTPTATVAPVFLEFKTTLKIEWACSSKRVRGWNSSWNAGMPGWPWLALQYPVFSKFKTPPKNWVSMLLKEWGPLWGVCFHESMRKEKIWERLVLKEPAFSEQVSS